MRFLLLIVSALLVLPCFALNPIFLREGDKLDKLTLESGEVIEDVKVTKISAQGVTVMGSFGVKTVPRAQLPGYEHLFRKFDKQEEAKAAEQAEKESLEEKVAKEEPENSWKPQNVQDCIKVCLKVEVSKGVDEYGQKASWAGSAFLCNEKGISYIYSNVHNFFGAKEFRLLYQDGREIPANHLGTVEVADGESGLFVKSNGLPHGWGGDVVRIRLKEYYPEALELDRTILSSSHVGKDIVITGNQGGRGVITVLEGKITSTEDNDIIIHNAATEPGNSGSPIIDAKTFKVIGILTWGMKLPDPLKRIWEKKDEEEREGINSGASLSRIKFARSSFNSLYEERLLLNNMKRCVRLLGLMDALVPSDKGVLVDTNMKVMGGYTVGELLSESPNHYVVKRLKSLHNEIKSKNTGIRMSNLDLLKVYVAAYQDCLKHLNRQTNEIEDRMYMKSYFFQCSVKNTYMVQISRAYERSIAKAIKWYYEQRGLSGKAIPLTKRVRLPRLESGLQGLGIQQE